MVTVTFCFPHHVSRQAELRLPHLHVGCPVTATIAFQHHASRQVERRSIRAHAGSPVTTTLGLAPPPIRTELRLQYAIAGNSVTERLVFPYPPIRTELRSVCGYEGSPVTAILAFSHPLQQTGLRSTYAQVGNPITARFVFPKLSTQTVTLKWESARKTYTIATIRFRNDYRNLVTESIGFRYDCKTIINIAAMRYQHRSLVRAGWRIVARNLESGESFDLGFIDADAESPALEDVFLPDGEYEISVLTSSLFWKDCLDRTVRTISVRPGGEVTPLPVIYNLRAAVLNGLTTIRWSASRSELNDCVFGVWYDAQSPVEINRPPDTTVRYYSAQIEYVTTFRQNAPAYVAVAAMRVGNEPETGKAHELHLDWSSVPPRRPDDVVVLNAPLPAIDPAIAVKNANDPSLSLWF